MADRQRGVWRERRFQPRPDSSLSDLRREQSKKGDGQARDAQWATLEEVTDVDRTTGGTADV